MRLGGTTRAGEGGSLDLRTHRRSLGVVALITPWNFPWAVPVWKLAPALITGNTVVLKGSELTPMMNTFIGLLLLEAGLPPGVFNVVQGTKEVVRTLVAHQDVRAVSFTGSTKTFSGPEGIYKYMAAERPDIIPVQAELGGNNAVYIGESADMDLALAGVMAGKYGSAGQRCTATQRVAVHHSRKTEFLERLDVAAGMLVVGASNDRTVSVMGPLVSDEHRTHVLNMCASAGESATLLFGGNAIETGQRKAGSFMEPTAFLLYGDNEHRSPLWRDEIFGPVLVVREAGSFEEGLAMINDSDLGLAASIFSEDRRELQAFEDGAQVGKVHLNEGTAGGEFPVEFGGWKNTGVGLREMGDEAAQFFTRGQSVFDARATAGGKAASR